MSAPRFLCSLLSSAAALVSPPLIKPPGSVLLFKNTVVALVSTKPNRLQVCVISRYLLLCNLSLMSYHKTKKKGTSIIQDSVSYQIACAFLAKVMFWEARCYLHKRIQKVSHDDRFFTHNVIGNLKVIRKRCNFQVLSNEFHHYFIMTRPLSLSPPSHPPLSPFFDTLLTIEPSRKSAYNHGNQNGSDPFHAHPHTQPGGEKCRSR